MDIMQRAKNICLTPTTEGPVIAAEPATPGALLTGYAAPLAAIGAVASFMGGAIIGQTLPFVGHYRVPLATGLIAAIFTFGMALVGVFVPIGLERATNPFLRCPDLAAFIALKRDWPTVKQQRGLK